FGTTLIWPATGAHNHCRITDRTRITYRPLRLRPINPSCDSCAEGPEGCHSSRLRDTWRALERPPALPPRPPLLPLRGCSPLPAGLAPLRPSPRPSAGPPCRRLLYRPAPARP